jgi:hypothetical protein
MDCVIELANAFETRAKRNLGHREPRFLDELSCEVNPVGRRDLERGSTEMLHKKTAQLARAES